MQRNMVADKHKWKLEDIYASNEAWEADFSQVQSECKRIADFKGRLASRDALLECLKFSDKIINLIQKLGAYAYMRFSEDNRVDTYVGMLGRVESLGVEYGTEAAFITSEISGLDEKYLQDAIADQKFADFDYYLKDLIRVKKHILSDKEEKILSMAQGATGGAGSAFTMLNNVDLPLPTVKIEGEKVKLTPGKYGYYLTTGDQKTRKLCFSNMYNAYKGLINTFAATYDGSVKSDNFYATARGFKSALEQALHSNDIPRGVYDNLIKAVNSALPVMHDYIALRKKALGVSSLNMYDMHVPIVEGAKIELEYEDAYKLCQDGLKPMGTEYAALLQEAKDKRWIDVVETEGKGKGAYAYGVHGVHPYVLLNYSKTLNEIFTIAHELGHAMHSYYSSLSQPHAKHRYQIFVAEVASTVNEVLLLKHLIKNAKDKNEKAYLLNYYLDMFRTTLFRQTQFAEFEMLTHDMEKAGQPLTVGALCETYYKLNKKYYGKSVRHNDEIKYEWARIPHFYNAFYVYKYATGLTSAVNIAKNILETPGFVDVYKEKFLCAGGSKSAYEILKDTGVDLTQTTAYEVAMGEFKATLEELKSLIG